LFHKGGIGDLVFATPLIRDLKRAFAPCDLVVLTHRLGKEVLKLSPEVDCVVEGPPKIGASLGRELLARSPFSSFDVAMTTVRSPRAAWLLKCVKAPVRVGFASGPEQILYTHRAPVRPFEVRFARRFQRLLEVLGHPIGDAVPRMEVPPPLRDRAREQLIAAGWDPQTPLVAVHVGGGWPTKRWPIEHLLEFCRLARAEFGVSLLLQGGPEDRERARALRKQLGAPVLDAVGNPVSECLAQTSFCHFCLGLDSGLSHGAAALGIPTLHLFGPNNPDSVVVAPWQRLFFLPALACRPCNRKARKRCPKGHHRCMTDLDARAVYDLARTALKRVGEPTFKRA